MASVLQEVADAADAAAADQRQVARRARAIQRDRDQGRPWTEILDRPANRNIVDLARRSARLVTGAATKLASILAAGLTREGASRRQVAKRLGVTHQRVSALLNGNDRSRGPRG
ncbi:MAG: hypothetical protein ACRDZV_00370 [Acidimicrobiia bacterium]